MIYLYAGLGLAMLTGIMAIFDMGLYLTDSSLLLSRTDPYSLEAAVKEWDQRLLSALESPDALSSEMRGLEICQYLKLTDSLQQNWPFESAQEASGNIFVGACVMNAGSHRVLVWPDPSRPHHPYQLYSCLLQGSEQICLFEKKGVGS